jgi:two-component system, OmpR family, response regulator
MLKVLLIDDSKCVRMIARLGLSRLGEVEVLEAAGGQEGLDLARQAHPDAILLDVNMPGMNGPDTLRALRSDTRTSAIPVVFMTAEESRSQTDGLRALGAQGVLHKPFDPRTLFPQLQAHLALPAWGPQAAAA